MKVQTNQQDPGLLLAIAALKSQVSDLTLKCKQFQEASAILMQEKLPQEVANDMYAKVVEHLRERDIERSAQYKGVLQTALIGLNEIAMRTTDTRARDQLVEVIKNLTLTVECGSIKPKRKL